MLVERNKLRLALQFLILMIAVLLTFSPAFKSGFLPWDDKEYTIENADIKEFSGEHLKSFFSKSYLGNYEPVSMISYAADFAAGSESPFVYHFSNLLWHLLNCFFVLLLLKRITGKDGLAFTGALIFALHPMQAESVMWIAERKNLVYVFFFLLASLHYLRFKENSQLKFYFFSLLFFGLSLLSKGTAVTFPLCLIAFDLMRGENITKKNLLEKIPFFILSLIIGLLTIHFQKQDGYLNTEHDFNPFIKLLYGSFAFCFYIFKTILPVSLSSYYPFPAEPGAIHYLGLLAVVTFFTGIYFLLRRKAKETSSNQTFKFRRLLAGSLLFFVFNIIFVLQFIPFGEVLVAERYNYLGSLGLILFFILVIDEFSKSFFKNKLVPNVFAGIIITVFSILCFIRSKTWENSFTFYGDILKKYPDSYVIMSSLGAEYTKENNFEMAAGYFEKAIQKNPNYYSVYYNQGLLFLKQGKPEDAFNSLSKCIDIKPYPKALVARATILEQAKQFDRAIEDLNNALKQKPNNAKAFYLRALCKDESGNPESSLEDYNKAIQLQPKEALYYLNRAIAFGKLNRINESISDLNLAIEIKPDYAQAFYLRAIGKSKNKENPCEDLRRSAELGYKQAEAVMNKICR